MRKIFLFIIYTSFVISNFAQVSVHLQQPPPNQLRATDLWRLTLINSGKSTLAITLYGTLEASGQGIIVEGNSKLLSLSPGVKIITYDDVKNGDVSFKSGKWHDAFMRTSNAPSGDYTICIHVKDKSGEEIGSDCIDQSIAIVSSPSLNSPGDGETIPSAQPLAFTWLPPMPVPPGQLTYKLKIAEILGNQSASEAINRNASWFEKSGIKTTMFQYPLSARKMESNKKYAWTVQLTDSDGNGVGENNGMAESFMFNTGSGNGNTKSLIVSTPPDSTTSTGGTGTAAVGDTIKAGLNGEFKVIVTDVTAEPDSSLTGKGKVRIGWLMTYVAVEFKKIRVDTTKRLISGGIVTSESGSSSTSYQAYPKAWALSLLSGPGVANVVDNTVQWTNNLIDNLITWTNGLNFGQPQINYQSNIPPPPIPNNALKMPFGLQFNNGNQKLVITEMVFKPNESKINFLAQEQFTKAGTPYKLGFAGKYFKIHPNSIDFSAGRVELVQDISVPNTSSNPKMKFIFKQGTANSGCYVAWDSTGLKDVSLGMEVKFSRDWLLPVPTSTDTVKATLAGNGTSLHDILLTGTLPNCEIVGTNGLKIQVDSIALDLSDTRNPSSMYFPKNYTDDTTATAKLLWQGLYIKTFGITLPDAWKTGANPTQITASNLIIDDHGITTKITATNVFTFPSGRVADLSASLDTLNVSILKGSLTDGNAKGVLVLPISKDTVTNSLKYTASFSQASDSSNFQIVIVPSGPIDADVLKGQLTLLPTSNISADISSSTKSFAINLNGTFKWDNPNFSVGGNSINLKGVKMELGFENVGLNYSRTSSSNTLTFNPGSWSFASPQKFLANFPVSIKKIYYKSLNKVSPELLRGALMIDVVANLSEDIGGATSLGAGFAIEFNTSTRKFKPKFTGVLVDSIGVHANLQAVKIDGNIAIRNNDPIYGDGFLGELTVAFTPVNILAHALVEFGNTNYLNGSSLYRYWRVEADVLLPPPGIPFLTGIAFRGFGGGAYYNMNATLTTSANTPSGKRYTFKPKKSSFGLQVAATIATTPKEETFNADVGLLAQFSSHQGITYIAFTGDFWVGAGFAKRNKANVNGSVGVSYNFPDKHFNLSASVNVNAPPITTPSPSNLVLDINGKTNKWYFKFGEPSNLNTVNVFGVGLYEYLMFGNDITPPSGFTQTFRDGYHGVFGSYPGIAVTTDGVTNSNTATGRGLALGIGFTFNKNINFDIISSYNLNLALGAGAELNLAYAEYNGQNCENPSERIGINGWQASGSIGFYAYVNASVQHNSSTWNIADIKAGGWLQGKFPNPVYVAGEIQGSVKIGHFTTPQHLLDGRFSDKPHWRACTHLTDHYLVNASFDKNFEYGTNCSGITSAGNGAPVTQGDAAGDQQQLLIKYVHPTQQYNFPLTAPLAVQYGLIPNNVFDVAEQQADGSIKNRTFKMVVSTNLKIHNDDGSYTNQPLSKNENNLDEFLYTVIVQNVINTSTQFTASQNLSHINTVSSNTNTAHAFSTASLSHNNNLQTITYPVPPSTSTYSNLPPEPPEINNNLTINKNYVFTVTATLKEFVNNTWVNAKNKNNVAVAQTVTKYFRTGSLVATNNTQLQNIKHH